MKSFLKFLQFGFIPRSSDLALLVLRVWLGISLLALHGWAKLTNFSSMAGRFPDPLGIGPKGSLALAIFAEVLCAVLLALGLATRFAALVLIVLLAVAFLLVHGRALSGAGSGEMAFIYLAGFVTVFLAGPGRYSVDAKLGGAA